MRVYWSGDDWSRVGRRGHSGVDFLDGINLGGNALNLGDEPLSPWTDDLRSSTDTVQRNELGGELVLESEDITRVLANIVGVEVSWERLRGIQTEDLCIHWSGNQLVNFCFYFL